jgi:hypothetical protein
MNPSDGLMGRPIFHPSFVIDNGETKGSKLFIQKNKKKTNSLFAYVLKGVNCPFTYLFTVYLTTFFVSCIKSTEQNGRSLNNEFEKTNHY